MPHRVQLAASGEGADVRGEVAGPGSGSSSGQPLLGQVEVLDDELALVAELVEPARARRRSRRRRVGSSTCTWVRPGLALAQLHVVGELEQLARVAAPVGDVTGVDEQPQARHLGRNIAGIVSSEFTTAPAHGSSSAPGAARHHRTARSHIPSPSRGAGVAHQPGCGFGNAVGQPIGSASVAGSVDRARSMCSKPSSRPRRAALGDVAARRVDDVDDAERPLPHAHVALLAPSTSA